MSDSDLMGRGQAARYVEVSEITVDRMVKRGQLKFVWVGPARKYRRADLDEIIRQRTAVKESAEVSTK